MANSQCLPDLTTIPAEAQGDHKKFDLPDIQVRPVAINPLKGLRRETDEEKTARLHQMVLIRLGETAGLLRELGLYSGHDASYTPQDNQAPVLDSILGFFMAARTRMSDFANSPHTYDVTTKDDELPEPDTTATAGSQDHTTLLDRSVHDATETPEPFSSYAAGCSVFDSGLDNLFGSDNSFDPDDIFEEDNPFDSVSIFDLNDFVNSENISGSDLGGEVPKIAQTDSSTSDTRAAPKQSINGENTPDNKTLSDVREIPEARSLPHAGKKVEFAARLQLSDKTVASEPTGAEDSEWDREMESELDNEVLETVTTHASASNAPAVAVATEQLSEKGNTLIVVLKVGKERLARTIQALSRKIGSGVGSAEDREEPITIFAEYAAPELTLTLDAAAGPVLPRI